METYDKNGDDIVVEVTSTSKNIGHEFIMQVNDLLRPKGLITRGSKTTVESVELIPEQGVKHG